MKHCLTCNAERAVIFSLAGNGGVQETCATCGAGVSSAKPPRPVTQADDDDVLSDPTKLVNAHTVRERKVLRLVPPNDSAPWQTEQIIVAARERLTAVETELARLNELRAERTRLKRIVKAAK